MFVALSRARVTRQVWRTLPAIPHAHRWCCYLGQQTRARFAGIPTAWQQSPQLQQQLLELEAAANSDAQDQGSSVLLASLMFVVGLADFFGRIAPFDGVVRLATRPPVDCSVAAPSISWTDCGESITVEGEGRSVQLTVRGFRSARASVGVSSGILEWDCIVPSRAAGIHIGVCTSSMPLAGRDTGFYRSTVSLFSRGSLCSGLLGQAAVHAPEYKFGTDDVIGLRLDMDAGTLVVSKNGDPVATLSGLKDKGPLYPFVGLSLPGDRCCIRARSSG